MHNISHIKPWAAYIADSLVMHNIGYVVPRAALIVGFLVMHNIGYIRSWTAFIVGYAQERKGPKALEYLKQMQCKG